MIYWILLPFVNTVGNIKYLYDHCTSRKTQAKERQLQYPKSCVVTFIQLWPNFCQSVWCSRVRPGQRGWVEQHHSLQGEGSSPYIVIILYSPSHLLGATTVVFFFLIKTTQVYWVGIPSVLVLSQGVGTPKPYFINALYLFTSTFPLPPPSPKDNVNMEFLKPSRAF